ncbi:sugar ABC transporter permease [Actinoplanes sp. NPDC051851]|uniref:carbohydrate ABC transporter permease n=1 Tax=Actinoplanes sp. NPDC051851 TaxID=3154753 RepID=UPI00343472E3
MVDSVQRTAEPAIGPVNHDKPRRRFRRKLNSYTGAPLLMISINLVLFALFFVWPAAIGLGYSFTSYTGIGDAPFVGTDNYTKLFADPAFWAALKRTLIYTASVVPLSFVAALGTAYLLVSPYTKGKSVARVVFFLPWLISPIIVGVIWRWLFGENFGLVNFIIEKFGGSAVSWQSNGDLSLIVVIVAATWAGTAFNMLLFIAALKNVPVSYYEAADLDGANAWQKFRRITLPAIAPTSFIVILLSTLHTMKEYSLIVAVNAGGPGTENNLIVQYIYSTGFRKAQIGYASAASFILLLILMVIALVQMLANRRKGN